MSPRVPTVLCFLHLALVLAHDLSHLRLGLWSTPLALMTVLIVVHLAPMLGLLFWWRAQQRAGLAWLALGFAGSLVYASYAHFAPGSSEHVQHASTGGWDTLFLATAWLISATDALGVLATLSAARNVLLPRGRSVLMIDGTCVACNHIVAFILRHDRKGHYHFAHIQSPYGQEALLRHGADASDIDTLYLLTDAGTQGEALLLDGALGRVVWPSLFIILTPLLLLPRQLLDPSYRLFARYRYRLFGRYETCLVPTPAQRARFLSATP